MTIQNNFQEMALEILNSNKYKGLGIPVVTVLDILMREFNTSQDEKVAIKATRKKIHQLMAPYLDTTNYEAAVELLQKAVQSRDVEELHTACRHILAQHASTLERLPILDTFYHTIFQHIGKPRIILDLACGLNPLTIPWMNLDEDVQYHAFDIHQPRIEFINHFFSIMNFPELAKVQDVLVEPPSEKADVAFFFKEAHRMEQRRRGSNRELWRELKVDTLLVSLPINSLSGRHDLRAQMRHLVETTMKGNSWQMTEIIFENEMVFCIKK